MYFLKNNPVAGAQGFKAEDVASTSFSAVTLFEDVCVVLFFLLQCDCVGPKLQAQVLSHL